MILYTFGFLESIFMVPSIRVFFQIFHELLVRDKVIQLFSINLEFKPELVFSGNLSLIKGMDMVIYGNPLPLSIVIHRKQKCLPQKIIKVDSGHERRFFQIRQDEDYYNQTLQMLDLVVDPPLLEVQPEVRRSVSWHF